jgi:hypothetical protein
MLCSNTVLCSRKEFLAQCFPMRFELPFERNTAYLSGFLSVRNISFVQNSSIHVKGRSSVSWKKTTYVRSTMIWPIDSLKK